MGKESHINVFSNFLFSENISFKSREKEILQLRQKLNEFNKLSIITGLGGVGKSFLAKAFVSKFQKDYSHIIWISKTGQNILHDFADDKLLIKALGLKDVFNNPNLSYEERLIDIKQALEQKTGSKKLLVLDNVDKELEDSQALQLLPQQNGWQLLVTSRNQSNRIKQQLKLDVLSAENAAKLFCLHYPNAKNDTDLKALLEYIGWHTLTTELLAKLMAKKALFGGINCGELLDKLKAHDLNDDEIRKKLAAENYTDAEQSLFAHLMVCFDTDNLDKWELWWLKHFTLLPPQAYNYNDLKHLLSLDEYESNKIENALDSLVKTGWIKAYEKEEAHYYECHRLLQEVLLHKEELEWGDSSDLERYIWNISNLIFVDESKEHWIDKKQWLPFCDRLYELRLEYQTEAFGRFLNEYAMLLESAYGNYKKAVEVYEKSLQIILELEGEEGENVSSSRSNLAIVYRNLGRHKEAVDLLEKALKSAIENLGEEHPAVANLQSNLANVYGDLGRYEEAADLLEKALASAIKNFGEEYPSVTICQSNLANVYRHLGRYNEAVDLLEKALKSAIHNFGVEHPSVSIRQSNLATIYVNLGRYGEAVDLLGKALESDIQNFGLVHPNTGARLNNLANPNLQLNRLEHAYSCLFIAVAIWLKCLGVNHPHTQQSVKGLVLFREMYPDIKVDIPFLIELLGVSRADIEALIYEAERFLEEG